MKHRRIGALCLLVALLGQGCATVSTPKKIAAKKKVIPAMHKESYALMEETEEIDKEIILRGNKARGLSEY